MYIKAYLFLKIADKLKVIIWYNKIKRIIFLIEFNKLDAVYTNSINFLHKYKYDIFKKAIHNNHYINTNFFVNFNESK